MPRLLLFHSRSNVCVLRVGGKPPLLVSGEHHHLLWTTMDHYVHPVLPHGRYHIWYTCTYRCILLSIYIIWYAIHVYHIWYTCTFAYDCPYILYGTPYTCTIHVYRCILWSIYIIWYAIHVYVPVYHGPNGVLYHIWYRCTYSSTTCTMVASMAIPW